MMLPDVIVLEVLHHTRLGNWWFWRVNWRYEGEPEGIVRQHIWEGGDEMSAYLKTLEKARADYDAA